jgi:hypothetical protein
MDRVTGGGLDQTGFDSADREGVQLPLILVAEYLSRNGQVKGDDIWQSQGNDTVHEATVPTQQPAEWLSAGSFS